MKPSSLSGRPHPWHPRNRDGRGTGMAGLFATPSLAYGPNEGSCAGRAHPSRLAHASHLSDCPDIPTRSEQADRLPLFVATMIGESFFLGPLRLYTGSVWPASLGHATFNGTGADSCGLHCNFFPDRGVLLPRRGRRDFDRGGSCDRRHLAGLQVPGPPGGRVRRLGTRDWTPSRGWHAGWWVLSSTRCSRTSRPY